MSMQLLATKYTLGGRIFYDTALKFRIGPLLDLDRIGGPDNRPTDGPHLRALGISSDRKAF